MSDLNVNSIGPATAGAGVTITDPRYAAGPWIDITAAPYNAVGDDSTDNTTAITAALAAAAAAGSWSVKGGTVFIPQGTFQHSGITIPASRVNIVGAGMGRSILKLKANSNVAPIRSLGATQTYPSITTITDITLADFTVDGNVFNQTSSPAPYFEADGIWLKAVERVQIDRVEVYDTWTDGIMVQRFRKVAIRNCRVRRNGQSTVTVATTAVASATSGATTATLTMAGGMTVNAYSSKLLYINGGTGAGQLRGIQSNTATTFTLSDPWDFGATPDATSTYRVLTPAVNASGIGARGIADPTELTTSYDLLIHGNFVEANTGTGDGIFVSGDILASVVQFNYRKIVISGNTVTNVYDEGIETKNTNDTVIANNVVYGSLGGSDGRQASDGILTRVSQNTTVTTNEVRYYTSGISAFTDTIGIVSDVTITGNTVADCNKDLVNGGGIKVLAISGFNIQSTTITGNRVANSGKAGIRLNVAGGSLISGVNITGNTVSGGNYVGIWLDAGAVSHASVTGNVCYGSGAGGAGAGSGIYIDQCSDIVVSANRCYDVGSVQNFGITLANAANSIELVNNKCTGNVNDGFRYASFTGNTHYKRGNHYSSGGNLQGTAVLVGGTVTVTNSEIRAGDTVQLTILTRGGTLGVVALGTIVVATSFVINSSNAAETSTVAWEIVH